MAGNDKKGSLPSFSPTPTLDDLFNGNTTIGRIKSMQCMRDGADPKACAREELKKKQQRYADHASGKDPLPPSESLALRSDIDRLSQVVNPGSQNAWPPNSEAETAYLADKAMAERRAANNIGIAAGSPVFTALPAAGRVLGASENAVEGLAVLNVDIVGALGFGGRGGGRGRSAKPASNETTTSRSTSPSPKPASPGNGTYVEKKPPPVKWGAQEKHFPGHNSYTPGRSTMTSNPDKLAERAGTGQQVGDIPVGQAGSKERVDFGERIGTYIDQEGNASSTTKGIIHYSDNGIHIVPARP